MSVLARKQRRTYLRAEDRRAQILAVAKDVFADLGYHRASIADICTGAGIGRGTLYQYFDNKAAVMLAILEGIEQRVTEFLDGRRRLSSIAGLTTVSQELMLPYCKARLRELLDVVFADAPTLRLVFGRAEGPEGAATELIARIDRAFLAAIESDLDDARAAGLLRAQDTRLAARFILGGVQKLVLTALTEDEPVDLSAIVHTAVEMQLFGLLRAAV